MESDGLNIDRLNSDGFDTEQNLRDSVADKPNVDSANVAAVRSALRLGWQEMPISARCRLVGGARHHIVDIMDALVSEVASPQRKRPSETLGAELVPLCDALAFLQKRGARILKTRQVGFKDRPLWMWGVRSQVQRVPRGVVLVIGTWNYPLLLAGVQVAQALAAGNGVIWKPAAGCERSTELLAESFWKAGVPRDCLRVTGSETEHAVATMRQGVDLIVLTGAAETGRKVMRQASETLTPVLLELSGCDAMVVLPGADLDLVINALRFAITLNSGATCIGPRRLMVHQSVAEELSDRTKTLLDGCESYAVHPAARPGVVAAIESAEQAGANSMRGNADLSRIEQTGEMEPLVLDNANADMEAMNADLFAPISGFMIFHDAVEPVQWVNQCPYGLSASVFGPNLAALQLAQQLEVGSVVINDLIAPTADPRLPFGGRRQSGFGATRGVEGLIEMTVPKVVIERRSGPAVHLRPPNPSDPQILGGVLAWQHAASLRKRLAGLRRLVAGVRLTNKR